MINLTQREKKLSKASEDGAYAYRNKLQIPEEYKNDPILKQAWNNGYVIAQQQDIDNHLIGFY